MQRMGVGALIARLVRSLMAMVALVDVAQALEPAVLVRDILPNGSSGPTELTRLGGRVFFTAVADGAGIGRELWATDGTAAGTVLVRDVNPEPFRDGEIAHLTAFHGALYFGVGSPFHIGPHGLWRSDGTTDGTGPVTNFLESAGALSPSTRRMFFLASTMFSTDICWLDLDQRVGCAGRGLRVLPTQPRAVAGDHFFAVAAPAYDSVDFELWTSDGSAEGTHLLRDIRPGTGSSGPTELTALGSTLYFVADDGTAGSRLWRSDGSESGTYPVAAAPRSPNGLIAVGEQLFFVGETDAAFALWVLDGTDSEPRLVRRFGPIPNFRGLYPVGTLGDAALFLANNASDLWISDGTTAGTRRLRTFPTLAFGSAPYGFTDIGGVAVFTGCGAQGCEPWITDGTAKGTKQLADVWPGAQSSFPDEYTRLGRQLLFRALTDADDELWKIEIPGAAACAGDCDGDGRTTVAELTLGVSLVLGSRPLTSCAALEIDGDGEPSIADLIGAVAAALTGCPAA